MKRVNHGKKILVIDDDANIIQIMTRILGKNGYRVFIAQDGEAGLKRMEEDIPELVILDLSLPKIHGEEVCKKIKGAEKTKDIPVIILSGRNSDTDKIIGKVIGADYYITKPFDIKNLLENIASAFKE